MYKQVKILLGKAGGVQGVHGVSYKKGDTIFTTAATADRHPTKFQILRDATKAEYEAFWNPKGKTVRGRIIPVEAVEEAPAPKASKVATKQPSKPGRTVTR